MNLIHIQLILSVNFAYSFLIPSGNSRCFCIYGKNPDYEKKKLEQRRSKIFKRVLPQESDKLDRQIKNLIKTHTNYQISAFGHRLSQYPGDGGEIPNLNSATDKIKCVKNYYRFLTKIDNNNENFKLYKSDEDKYARLIAENPRITFGIYESKGAILNDVFYKPLPDFFPDEEFKETIRRKIKRKKFKLDMDNITKRTRGYHGLKSEVLFSNLKKEYLDNLREIEIATKSGNFSQYNPLFKIRRKKTQKSHASLTKLK